MKFPNKVISILFLGIVKSTVATLANNVTTNSTAFEADVPVLSHEIFEQITAVTLAHIVHGTSDDLGDVDTTLRVAEEALSTSRRYNGQQSENNDFVDEEEVKSHIEVMHDNVLIEDVTTANEIGGNDSEHHISTETLLDLMENVVDENIISIKNERELVQERKDLIQQEDKRVIEDVLLGMRALPDNATFWELFKAQVRADFAPILIIIPRPIKKLIAENAVKIGRKLKVILVGPMTPMISVAGKVIGIIGNGIIYVGEDVVKLADFLVSVANKSLLGSQQQINTSDLHIIESEDEGSTDDIESVNSVHVLNYTVNVESDQIDKEVIVKDANNIGIHEFDDMEMNDLADDPLADEIIESDEIVESDKIIESELIRSSEENADLSSEVEVKGNSIVVDNTESADLSIESDQSDLISNDTAAVDSIIDMNISDIDDHSDVQEQSEINVETDYIEL